MTLEESIRLLVTSYALWLWPVLPYWILFYVGGLLV